MRAGQGIGQLERIVSQYFRPLFAKVSEVIKKGIAENDFRKVDPMHFIPSMIAVITFYFTSAPVMRVMTGDDPFSAPRIVQRRAAVLDFISSALFVPKGRAQQGERA
jgi:hypothetical protein